MGRDIEFIIHGVEGVGKDIEFNIPEVGKVKREGIKGHRR